MPPSEITVIVTTLNAGRELPRLLSSLENQKSGNFKLLIVDGGSTDETVPIIRSNPKIKLINAPGLSIYQGLNEGIKHCETRYYIIAGADDEFEVDAFEQILYDIKHTPGVDLFLYSVRAGTKLIKPKTISRLRLHLGWQSIISSHSVGTVINRNLHHRFDFYNIKYPVLADGHFLAKVLNSNSTVFYSNIVVGKFGTEGVSNRNLFENIFTTFQIQIQFRNFFIQLLLLCFRLIKYRKYAN